MFLNILLYFCVKYLPIKCDILKLELPCPEWAEGLMYGWLKQHQDCRMSSAAEHVQYNKQGKHGVNAESAFTQYDCFKALNYQTVDRDTFKPG